MFLKKKILLFFLSSFLYFLMIALIVYIFSILSLIKGKTHNFFWVTSIQKEVYFGGLINLWQQNKKCTNFDEDLLYVPAKGECKFENIEFKTVITIKDQHRDNKNRLNIPNNKKNNIVVIGDSVTMGWGVNDDETFSSLLERKINRKVYNLGVSSYGTRRELKRLVKSGYLEKADTILIQYCDNDLSENIELSNNKKYTADYYNYLMTYEPKKFDNYKFLLRKYKSSWRLFFKDLTNIFRNNEPKISFAKHYSALEKVLNEYNDFFLNKKVIVFHVAPSKNFFYDMSSFNYKNFEFINIIVDPKKHNFTIDPHLNKNGNEYVASKLFNELKTILPKH